MDQFITTFDVVEDRDLLLCHKHGCAYQKYLNAAMLVQYDDAYFDKYVEYEGTDIAAKLNNGRKAFVDAHVGADCGVLDIGIGSGEFIKSRPSTFGHDINEKAISWLRSNGKWATSLWAFLAFTFWDVVEHIPDPNFYFRQVALGSHVFISIPIFDNLSCIRESKHYRPNEHLYYFTQDGLISWMALYGFKIKEVSDFESAAGREDIMSFAFERVSRPA